MKSALEFHAHVFTSQISATKIKVAPSRCLAFVLGALGAFAMPAHAGTTTQRYAVSGLAAVDARLNIAGCVNGTCLYSGGAVHTDYYDSTPFQAFDTSIGVLQGLYINYTGNAYLSSNSMHDPGPGLTPLNYQHASGALHVNGMKISEMEAEKYMSLGVLSSENLSGNTVLFHAQAGGSSQLAAFAGTGERTLKAELNVHEYAIGLPTMYGQGVFQAQFSGDVSYQWLEHSLPSFSQVDLQDTLTLDFGDVVQGSAPTTRLGFVFNNASSFDGAKMAPAGADILSASTGFSNIRFSSYSVAPSDSTAVFLSFTPTNESGLQRLRAELNFVDSVSGVGQRTQKLTLFATANVIAAVPEPSSLALIPIGMVVAAMSIKRRPGLSASKPTNDR